MPLISVAETYDSNVFYTPKQFLPPGLKAEDFYTTITPQLIVAHTGRQIDANLSAGAVIQKFVNNPDLDNVGINVASSISLTRATRSYLPRLSNLQLLGTYQYFPSSSAFGGGGAGFAGGGFGVVGGGIGGGFGGLGAFDAGQVTQRIRTTTYSVGPTATYALSPTADFLTSYIYTKLSFGGNFGVTEQQTNNLLFDTDAHMITAGPFVRVSTTDTLGFNYIYSLFSQPEADSFKTHSGTFTWSKGWTRELMSSLGGGLTLLEPFADTSQGTGQRIATTIFPNGTVMLTWASTSSLLKRAGGEGGVLGSLPSLAGSVRPGTTFGRGAYSVAFSYNVGVFPSFVGNAGPIYSHIIGVTSSFGMTDRLTAQFGANYARSTGAIEGSNFAFTTYGTTVGLNYLLLPTLQATLTHNWLKFEDESPAMLTAASGPSGAFSFGKQMVLLGFTFTLAGNDFFKRGAFWSSSAPTSGVGAGSGAGPAAPEKSDTGGIGTKK